SCATGRNGFPLERGAFATRWNADAFSTGLFVGSGGALGRGGGGGGGRFAGGGALRGLGRLLRGDDLAVGHMGAQVVHPGGVALGLQVVAVGLGVFGPQVAVFVGQHLPQVQEIAALFHRQGGQVVVH